MTKKRFIISILIAVILLGLLCVCTSKEEWNTLFSKESRQKDLNALTNIAHEIIESKNISKPSSEVLSIYRATVNDDGTMKISLFGKSTVNVKVILTEDFEIQSFKTQDQIIAYIFTIVFIHLVTSIAITEIGYGLFKIGKKL